MLHASSASSASRSSHFGWGVPSARTNERQKNGHPCTVDLSRALALDENAVAQTRCDSLRLPAAVALLHRCSCPTTVSACSAWGMKRVLTSNVANVHRLGWRCEKVAGHFLQGLIPRCWGLLGRVAVVEAYRQLDSRFSSLRLVSPLSATSFTRAPSCHRATHQHDRV